MRELRYADIETGREALPALLAGTSGVGRMSLFICDRCRAVENTALGKFWCRRPRKLPRLCSECATGTWHGRFPKEAYNPVTHAHIEIIGQDGAA